MDGEDRSIDKGGLFVVPSLFDEECGKDRILRRVAL